MTFDEQLQKWTDSFGDKVAVEEYGGFSRTYAQMQEDILKCAGFFSEVDAKRIAIVGSNSYIWTCNTYGALCAGKTVIAIDPLLSADNITVLLKYTDVEEIYSDEEDRKLRKAANNEGMEFKLFYTMEQIESTESVNRDINTETGDILIFTSGTSSQAKGCVIPFMSICENARCYAYDVADGIEGKTYIPVPYNHIYANTLHLTMFHQGRTVCIGSSRKLEQEIAYFKPSVLILVPSLAEFVVSNKLFTEEAKIITVAGAKCEKSLETLCIDNNVLLQNLYGTSESAGSAAISKVGCSIEELYPTRSVVIKEENDEIVVETSMHMREYYKNPDATEAILKGDRLYLGDVIRFNDNGSFTPLGRKQDVIAMKNGDKLYCNEMDEELSSLEGVTEACIIYINEKIVAVAVAPKESEELVRKNIKLYNKRQPYYRKIDDVWFRQNPLPRNGMGKLVRRKVAEEYNSNQEEK